MKTYGQYCPVARALEVVGDRWSLLIVRDLLLGDRGFNELERGLPGISRSLLAQRLRLLERGGVVTRELGEDGRARAYALTEGGRELAPLIDAARIWGGRWAFEDPRPGEIDPAWLLTSMLRRRKSAALPRRRIVVEFRVRGGRRPTRLARARSARRERSVSQGSGLSRRSRDFRRGPRPLPRLAGSAPARARPSGAASSRSREPASSSARFPPGSSGRRFRRRRSERRP